MEEDYDVIVLGTGLKECILSGLMSSIAKKKVLHLDRNSYYGGESASLNLDQLFDKFDMKEKPPKELGASRNYCVDLCPKFLMSCGNLVKILLKTKVTDYLEFRSVAASYYYRNGKLIKVPSAPTEVASSSLIGFFDIAKLKRFLQFVGSYDPADEKTHLKKKKIDEMTAEELYSHFGLGTALQNFIGESIGLFMDDSYKKKPAIELVQRGQLYAESVSRYGNSPYIYPKWGLGGLPEGFSRRCAVHGGVYMLNSENKDNFVEKIHYNDKGVVSGVQVGGKVAKCKLLIGDPSYFVGTDKIKQHGEISRGIFILDHPIASTNNADSCQIIIPAKNIVTKKTKYKERTTNIFVCMSSFQHNIAHEGMYIAVCSAISEQKEIIDDLRPAIDLFGDVKQQFLWKTPYYKPDTKKQKDDNVFITTSYDATTHFESCSSEVLELYEDIIGEALDLTTEQSKKEQSTEQSKEES